MNRMECTVFFILTLCLVHVAYSQQSDPTRGRIAVSTDTVPPPANICSCYYSRDCKGRTATCQRGTYCLPSGKNDGVCNIGTAPTALPNLDALSVENRALLLSDRRAISAAVDAYFRSFVKAIENGGGFPDPNLLQDALDARLSQTAHDRVEQVVWASLDAVIGWDFESPTPIQKAQGFAGNVREVGGSKTPRELWTLLGVASLRLLRPTMRETLHRRCWTFGRRTLDICRITLDVVIPTATRKFQT